MKKQLLYMLFGCLVMTISFAQTTKESQSKDNSGEKDRTKIRRVRKTQFGVRSGFNYGNVSGSFIQRFRPRYDYHVGGYLQFPFPKKKRTFLIDAGLSYSRKGGGFVMRDQDLVDIYGPRPAEISDQTTFFQTTYRTSHIDIPIVLKDNQSEKFSPYAGFNLSYALTQNAEVLYEEVNDGSPNSVGTWDVEEIQGARAVLLYTIVGMEYHVNTFLNANISFHIPLQTLDRENIHEVNLNLIQVSIGFTF